MKYLLIIAISIVSLFVQSCEAQPKLPNLMPNDVQIAFSNHSENQTVTIDRENLTIQGGEGWHNRTKKIIKISPADAEKIYQILLENNFDEMKNDSTGELNEKINNSISVYSSQINLTVYQGILRLSAKNQERFETIRLAILDFAEKHKE